MGVLIVPSFLLYATGGLAYGGARSDTTIVQSIDDPPLSTLMTSGSFSKTRVGYAVGAGGEWMLSSNWSAKLEYLYYDLGFVTYATGGLASDIGAVLNPVPAPVWLLSLLLPRSASRTASFASA
jgi:outer membrane immunogenic protein